MGNGGQKAGQERKEEHYELAINFRGAKNGEDVVRTDGKCWAGLLPGEGLGGEELKYGQQCKLSSLRVRGGGGEWLEKLGN